MAVTHSFFVLDELESMHIGEEDERGDIGKGLDMTGSAELSSVCSIALCLLYHVVLSLWWVVGGGGGGGSQRLLSLNPTTVLVDLLFGFWLLLCCDNNHH